MEHLMQCWAEGCLGWHPGTAAVDGVEVPTTFCAHHAALRMNAEWALHPCRRFEARAGKACGCPPGEPWGACAAIRAHYLPLALTSCMASGGELAALRELALAYGAAPAPSNPGASLHVRAPGGRVVPTVRQPTGMPATSGTRPRRTGLTTA